MSLVTHRARAAAVPVPNNEIKRETEEMTVAPEHGRGDGRRTSTELRLG